MKRTTLLCLSIALIFSMSAQAAPPKKGSAGPKKIYCWEENGAKVCGDALPASAVNSARTEISGKTGLATKHVDRTMTDEERQAGALAAQQAAAAQAAALLQQQQQQKLVLSYADEAALNRAYDDKEAAVKNTMAEIQKGIDSIREVLVAKLHIAAGQEIDKKPLAGPSAKSIRDLHGQIQAQEAVQARNRLAIGALKQERASSLAMFRAALQTAAVPTATVEPSVATDAQPPVSAPPTR